MPYYPHDSRYPRDLQSSAFSEPSHQKADLPQHGSRDAIIAVSLGLIWGNTNYVNHHRKPHTLPIGSMYAIYGNIYHQYTPHVSIYTIHGSYGL